MSKQFALTRKNTSKEDFGLNLIAKHGRIHLERPTGILAKKNLVSQGDQLLSFMGKDAGKDISLEQIQYHLRNEKNIWAMTLNIDSDASSMSTDSYVSNDDGDDDDDYALSSQAESADMGPSMVGMNISQDMSIYASSTDDGELDSSFDVDDDSYDPSKSDSIPKPAVRKNSGRIPKRRKDYDEEYGNKARRNGDDDDESEEYSDDDDEEEEEEEEEDSNSIYQFCYKHRYAIMIGMILLIIANIIMMIFYMK